MNHQTNYTDEEEGLEGVKYCEKLSTERNFAGAIIGDTWVATFMAHVDILGPVHVMKWKRRDIGLPRGIAPSIENVAEALRACWRQESSGTLAACRGALPPNPKVEYSKFFLCLPAWMCRTTNATAEVRIEGGKWALRENRRNRVEESHVRLLEQEIVGPGNVPPGFVVTDYLPRYFTLDDGRRMLDPVGSITQKLTLQAHIVAADGYRVGELMECLRNMGISVSAVMSSFAATSELLENEDKIAGTVVVDVGTQNTCLTFYDEAAMANTSVIRGGTDDIIAKVATKLRRPFSDLTASIEQMSALLTSGKGEDEAGAEPLFAWRSNPAAVRELDAAAVPFADELADRIRSEVEKTREQQGIDIINAVVVGDNPLVVRALLHVLKEKTSLHCRWGKAANPHENGESDSPGYDHMIGMVRHHGIRRRRDSAVNAVEAYADSPASVLLRKAGTEIIEQIEKLMSRQDNGLRRFSGRPSVSAATSLLQNVERGRYPTGA